MGLLRGGGRLRAAVLLTLPPGLCMRDVGRVMGRIAREACVTRIEWLRDGAHDTVMTRNRSRREAAGDAVELLGSVRVDGTSESCSSIDVRACVSRNSYSCRFVPRRDVLSVVTVAVCE